MDFVAVVDQVIALLRQRGRVTYSTLKRQFQLDDAALEDVKNELIEGQRVAVDERGNVLVWVDIASPAVPAPSPTTPTQTPLTYTPSYLAEKILTSRTALEGERKQVTVLFADLKGSMELLADRDPEEARQLLDPVLERMMAAVHRYEGTVNQVMGDGIMALFGAPLAHEDHAVRACYAALGMQAAVHQYATEVQRTHGVPLQMRVGLNAGEVVVRAIGNDLRMDYSAIGQTTHLAARMEQMAMPGTILLTPAVVDLANGFIQATPLGPVPIKGLDAPVEVFELVGATALRRRIQTAVARGLSPFVGRQPELEALQQALARAGAGQGQVVALLGEPGVGKSRLVYELLHAHHTQGWLRLESGSVSYGKATAYLPVCDLLKAYCRIEDRDDLRTVRAKVTGQILTLDEALQDTVPAVLALFEALPADSPFLHLDPVQRRRRTLEALKRVLLRESQVQPLLLVFEDLHWIDSETQAVLDMLVESLPTARVLLLVNYRPEYQHGWGNKMYYTHVRLDPLPEASADSLLQALLGDDAGLVPLTQLLIARTQGNPFFLEESVRTLVETGVLVGERGAYRLAKPLDTWQVPPTVQALLAARLDRLPPQDKRLLQTAAVIGTEVPWLLLQAIADTADEPLHRSLAQLQAAEFLYETSLFPERAYTFKHALTHEVAYGSLLLERRRRLHERVAQAIEGLVAERVPEHYHTLAHHYSRSGNTTKAVDYLHRAGQQAVERSAYAEAVSHLTTALDLLRTLPESRERDQQELTLCIDLGKSLTTTKGWAGPEAEATYVRAWELCQQTGTTSQLVSVLWGYSQVYIVRADVIKHREVGARSFSLAHQRSDATLLMVSHWLTGTNLFHSGDYVTSWRHLEQAHTLYDPQQRPTHVTLGVDLRVFTLSYMSHTLWGLGYPEQAVQRSCEALALARDVHHPFSLALTQAYAAMLHQFRQEPQTASTHADMALALCTEHRMAYYLAWATIIQGWALAEQHRREEGLTQMQQGLTAFQATGGRLRFPYYLALLAEAYGHSGQVEKGLQLLDKACADMQQTGEHFWEAEQHRLQAELLLAYSTVDQTTAAAYLHQALEVARRHQAKSLELRAATSLARLWQSQGKRSEAYDLLAPVYGWFTEGFDTADLQDAKALLEELTG